MKNGLNIIFAGTPEFAAVALEALLTSEHNIIAVYTQPDRPAGRGRQLTASPVKQLAEKNNIPVYQPVSLKDANEQKILADLKADVMVVVAYGLLLPKPVLEAPRLGCINIHGSLLPRWRGAAPIHRAILAGDSKTGITIMQMDEGLDTGPMLYTVECDISAHDTSEILHDQLAKLGAEAIVTALSQLDCIKPIQQDNAHATYAKKITKEEAVLDWNNSAKQLANQVRAFNSWPVAFTIWNQQNLRVWQAEAVASDTKNQKPGCIIQVSPQGIDVATTDGILRLQKIQLPGGKIISAGDFLNAHRDQLTVGSQLG